MKIFESALSWLADKFDEWISHTPADNRLEPQDYDDLPEEPRLFRHSDRMGDEKGDFYDPL
jgi:hypothetical protein